MKLRCVGGSLSVCRHVNLFHILKHFCFLPVDPNLPTYLPTYLPTCGSQEDETWTWQLSGVNVAKNHSGKDDGKDGHPGPEYELLTLAFGLFAVSFFFFQSVGDLPLLYCLAGRRASSNLPKH